MQMEYNLETNGTCCKVCSEYVPTSQVVLINISNSVIIAGSLADNAPLLNQLYVNTMDAVNTTHNLPKNLQYSIFPALSINFGPDITCNPHKDHGNLADGFCWFMARSSFNSKTSGHLLLPELNLAMGCRFVHSLPVCLACAWQRPP